MLEAIVVLGLASATVATTVGVSKIFKPFRMWIAGQSEFLGDLISCPYCLGHYVAAVLTFAAPHRDVTASLILWLAVTSVSALISGAITFLFGAERES